MLHVQTRDSNRFAAGDAAQAKFDRDYGLPLTRDQQRHLKATRWLARAMDTRWGIGRFRFGAEAILNMIPIVGDFSSLAVSLYQLWIALKLNLPAAALMRLVANIGVDTAFGSVPFVGDAVDTAFKVHARNQRIIEAHLAATAARYEAA